jgi:hypothetical protein
MSYEGSYPPPQYQPPAVPPTEPKAIWALVTAIGGFFLCPIVLSVVGLILASQSLQTIRSAPGYWAGEGMAKAARILAIIGLVLGVLGVVFVLVWFAVLGPRIAEEVRQEIESGVQSDAFGYGDDATLDQLWDSCAAGDGQACDDLYSQAPIGSEYEQFGDTCGDRFEPGSVVCAQELPQ